MEYTQKTVQFLIGDTNWKTPPGEEVYKLVGRTTVDTLYNKNLLDPSNKISASLISGAAITNTPVNGTTLVYNNGEITWATSSSVPDRLLVDGLARIISGTIATSQVMTWNGANLVFALPGVNGTGGITFGTGATATTGIAIGTTATTTAGIAIGELASANIITSTAVGWSSFKSVTGAAANNTGFGHQTGFNITTGTQNTAVGSNALYFNTTGINNTAVGFNAMGFNSGLDGIRVPAAVNNNTAIGQNTMLFMQTGDFNTVLGVSAMRGSTPSVIAPTLNTASSNVCIGAEAMNWVYTATNNCVLGRDSLKFAGITTSNCTYGYQSGFCNTTYNMTNNISSNCAFGYQSLYVNPATATAANMSLNSAYGYLAMNFCGPLATNNCAFGANSLRLITANDNVAYGSDTGATLTTGTGNTLIGTSADVNLASAVDRIAIGRAITNTVNSTVIIGNAGTQYFSAGVNGSISQAHYVLAPAVTKVSVGAYTITAAEMQPGSVCVSTSQAGPETWTTATATDIIARLPNTITGASYIFYLRNEGANTITLAAGAGVTFGSGTYTVATVTCVTFKVTVTSGTTVTMQRVVSGPL